MTGFISRDCLKAHFFCALSQIFYLYCFYVQDPCSLDHSTFFDLHLTV